MSGSTGGVVAALAAAVALLATAAACVAAVPSDGSFVDGNGQRDGGPRISFQINGGDVTSFVVSSRACAAKVSASIEVSALGQFEYVGKARDLRRDERTRVRISGSFVSDARARGSIHQRDCEALRFNAKRRNI
jgi:hypothetical protein